MYQHTRSLRYINSGVANIVFIDFLMNYQLTIYNYITICKRLNLPKCYVKIGNENTIKYRW